jgi:SET and MYND domain-containing protein
MQLTQILTAYIDVSLPLAERQADLRARYGFVCDCALCAKGENWADPRWSVRHSGCTSGGIAPMPGAYLASTAAGVCPKLTTDLSLPGDAEVLCSCGQSFSTSVPSLRGLIEAGKRLLAADEDGELGELRTSLASADDRPRRRPVPACHPRAGPQYTRAT